MLTTASNQIRLDGAHRYFAGERELLGATRMLTDAGYIDTRWFNEAACLRGTYVHDAIALDLKGDLDEAALDEALVGYLAAARAFLRDSQAAIVLVEEPLADLTLGIAGKPDLVGTFFGKPACPDWKSGSPARWHQLQGAIYTHLVKVNGVLASPLIDAYPVYLHDDGTYALGAKTSMRDRAVAQALITIANDKRSAA